MNRSTLQPLRSRRYIPAVAQDSTPASPVPSAIESEARRTVAAIGLIWVAAARSFAPTAPAHRNRPTAIAA